MKPNPSSNPLPYAKSFHDLVVYQKARILTREVFQITKRFPKDEMYSLTNQWRRATRSVGAQIAEAWAKRRYVKHFVSKLTDADGEQTETQHWIIVAFDDNYISREEARHFGQLAQEIGRMLGEMMENGETFCGEAYALHESASSWFCESTKDDPLPGY